MVRILWFAYPIRTHAGKRAHASQYPGVCCLSVCDCTYTTVATVSHNYYWPNIRNHKELTFQSVCIMLSNEKPYHTSINCSMHCNSILHNFVKLHFFFCCSRIKIIAILHCCRASCCLYEHPVRPNEICLSVGDFCPFYFEFLKNLVNKSFQLAEILQCKRIEI